MDRQVWDTMAPRQADPTESVCCTFVLEELQRAQSRASHTAAAITALAENGAPLRREYKQQKAGTALGVLWLNGKQWEKGCVHFTEKTQHFETWAAVHRGIYLGA